MTHAADAESLRRAVVVVEPGVVDESALRELEKVTGRPVRYGSGTAEPGEAPVVYVGTRLPSPSSLSGVRPVWFHSTNAGVDSLLRDGSWPEDVLLTRTVGRMGERIGQYVVGWILAECQSVTVHAEQTHRRAWQRVPSELVTGQLALVYGAGQIGSRVGELLRACGIRAVGVGRGGRAQAVPADPSPFDEVVDVAAADRLLGEARWVVSTLPLTEGTGGTRDFFGAARFGALHGATFVNTGRGATVDLVALAAALESGAVRAAVLDVLTEEPPGPDHPVWRLPHTVVTSHSAGITAPDDVVVDFGRCWRELTEGRRPELAVDPELGY